MLLLALKMVRMVKRNPPPISITRWINSTQQNFLSLKPESDLEKPWFTDIKTLLQSNMNSLLLKVIDLEKSQICWLDSIREGFFHKTQRILIDIVYKQNTNHHSPSIFEPQLFKKILKLRCSYKGGGIPNMNIQVLFLYKLSSLIALSALSHVSKRFLIIKLHISHVIQTEYMIYNFLLLWDSGSKHL